MKKILISLLFIGITVYCQEKKTADQQIKHLKSKWEFLNLNSKVLMRNALQQKIKKIDKSKLSKETIDFLNEEILCKNLKFN
jgi:hypothetical protein